MASQVLEELNSIQNLPEFKSSGVPQEYLSLSRDRYIVEHNPVRSRFPSGPRTAAMNPGVKYFVDQQQRQAELQQESRVQQLSSRYYRWSVQLQKFLSDHGYGELRLPPMRRRDVRDLQGYDTFDFIHANGERFRVSTASDRRVRPGFDPLVLTFTAVS